MISVHEFATIAGAAKICGTSGDTIASATRSGRIQVYPLRCGTKLVKVAEVRQYAAAPPKRGRGADKIPPKRSDLTLQGYSSVSTEAERIGRHRNHVWRLISSGVMPSHRLACGAVVVNCKEVDKYMAGARNGPIGAGTLTLKITSRTTGGDVARALNAGEKLRPYRVAKDGTRKRCAIEVVRVNGAVELLVRE